MLKRIPISEARSQMNALSEQPEEVAITKRGEPVLAILPWALYEAIIETLEIMDTPDAMDAVRQDLYDLQNGKSTEGYTLQQVRERLGL